MNDLITSRPEKWMYFSKNFVEFMMKCGILDHDMDLFHAYLAYALEASRNAAIRKKIAIKDLEAWELAGVTLAREMDKLARDHGLL